MHSINYCGKIARYIPRPIPRGAYDIYEASAAIDAAVLRCEKTVLRKREKISATLRDKRIRAYRSLSFSLSVGLRRRARLKIRGSLSRSRVGTRAELN